MKHKPLQAVPRERPFSLDALRGFDMFWITGGSYLVTVIANYSGASWLKPVVEQMEHVPWNGFHFYDLIFPLFMFINGVGIPFALSKLDCTLGRFWCVVLHHRRNNVGLDAAILYV